METVKREMSDYPQQVHRIPSKNNAGLRKTIRFFVRFVIPQIKYYRKYFSLFFLFGIVYNLFIHCRKDD